MRTLHLPTQRQGGADPWKLHQQIARFGASTAGMPPVWVEEDPNGALRIIHSVTRAVRVAEISSGTPIRAEVIATRKRPVNTRLTVADVIS
jgi:hypothetical protein